MANHIFVIKFVRFATIATSIGSINMSYNILCFHPSL